MDVNKAVLAMYDIRGKQAYIYRSNKIREMVGASWIIEDLFVDYLLGSRGAAAEAFPDSQGIYDYRQETEKDKRYAFSEEGFCRHLDPEDGSRPYIGEIVYEGGGNFFVLYRDEETLKRVNRVFYRNILKNVYSLDVVCTYIDNVNFADYRDDQVRLYSKHARMENAQALLHPTNALPIVSIDNQTSLPMADLTQEQTFTHNLLPEDFPASLETYAKIAKYLEYTRYYKPEQDDSFLKEAHLIRQNYGESVLDDIVQEKGENSLLAVIHIDGNNMGAKVQNCLNNARSSSYTDCLKELRAFSENLQKRYVTDRVDRIVKALEESSDKKNRRNLISAGDDMTFICQAGQAMTAIKAYFDPNGENGFAAEDSACAGIAIFHSHFPYSEAYRIAEECCDNAKKYMRKTGLTEACLVDFYYIQSGVGSSLDKIREKETRDLVSLPWIIRISEKEKEMLTASSNAEALSERDYTSLLVPETDDTVGQLIRKLQKAAHSNVKGLLSAAKDGLMALRMEVDRMKAHRGKDTDISDFDFTLDGKLTREKTRQLIYNIVTAYDLWYRPAENAQEGRE